VNELDLGKEKITRLIAKFSIPCVISMVVAALYNIVDQIFIGWSEAGAFGNAARITNNYKNNEQGSGLTSPSSFHYQSSIYVFFTNDPYACFYRKIT